MGHELAHEQFSVSEKALKRYNINRVLINWIIEIHADYVGITITGNGDRNHFLQAIEYITQQRELEGKQNDRDTHTHPSYTRRMAYVKAYDFDELLIHAVASDLHLSADDTLLRQWSKEILGIFPPIFLKPHLP